MFIVNNNINNNRRCCKKILPEPEPEPEPMMEPEPEPEPEPMMEPEPEPEPEPMMPEVDLPNILGSYGNRIIGGSGVSLVDTGISGINVDSTTGDVNAIYYNPLNDTWQSTSIGVEVQPGDDIDTDIYAGTTDTGSSEAALMIGNPTDDAVKTVYVSNSTTTLRSIMNTRATPIFGQIDGDPGSNFGASVSVSENTYVIGAPTGENNQGYVEVYTYEQGVVTGLLGIRIKSGVVGSRFGQAVTQSDQVASGRGRIYVGAPGIRSIFAYKFISNRFRPYAQIQLNDLTGAGFSISSDQFGEYIAVGAPDSDTIILLGDNLNGFIFELDRISGDKGSRFGHAVNISPDGRLVTVGAPLSNNGSGETRIYEVSSQRVLKLAAIPAMGDPNSRAGTSVAVSNSGVVLTGAPGGNYTQPYVLIPNPSVTDDMMIAGGNGLHFDGVDDYVLIPNLKLDDERFSTGINMSIYIKPTSFEAGPSTRSVFLFSNFIDGETVYFFSLSLTSDGRLKIYIAQPTTEIDFESSEPQIQFDQWLVITIDINSNTKMFSLYLNEKLIHSRETAISPNGLGTLAGGLGNNFIVELSSGSLFPTPSINNYIGVMGDFRCYFGSLTAAEVKQTIGSSLVGNEKNLAHYYRFDHGTPFGNNTGQVVLTDSTGNNHGQLFNFALTGDTSNYVNGVPYEDFTN